MEPPALRRSIIQRLFGLCATKPPADPQAWAVHGKNVVVALSRVPELSQRNQAVRLEKKGLSYRLLLIHGDDDRFYAFKNRCTHGGRRLDPVPGARRLQCCSIGRSTYDYAGKVLSGPAKGPIETLPVHIEDGKVMIGVA